MANEITPVVFHLSPGQAADDPEGRKLIPKIPHNFQNNGIPLLMDKAYEGDEIRGLASLHGLNPVVPPKSNRKEPWEYDRELYKRRNEIERYFRRIKAFRRVFTRYDKLDIMYASFLTYAMICDTMRK